MKNKKDQIFKFGTVWDRGNICRHTFVQSIQKKKKPLKNKNSIYLPNMQNFRIFLNKIV